MIKFNVIKIVDLKGMSYITYYLQFYLNQKGWEEESDN